jgi:hypothetical protein
MFGGSQDEEHNPLALLPVALLRDAVDSSTNP